MFNFLLTFWMVMILLSETEKDSLKWQKCIYSGQIVCNIICHLSAPNRELNGIWQIPAEKMPSEAQKVLIMQAPYRLTIF